MADEKEGGQHSPEELGAGATSENSDGPLRARSTGGDAAEELAPPVPPKTRPSKADRIDYIVGLMTQVPNGWTRKARARAAIELDVSESTLEADAAEASRRVNSAASDPQLVARMLSELERNAEELEVLRAKGYAKDRIAAYKEHRETLLAQAGLRGLLKTNVKVGTDDDTLAAILRLGHVD